MQPILVVVGARPNFVKLAPLLRALDAHPLSSTVVHTGQHFDVQMSGDFFRTLGIRDPKVHLNCQASSRVGQLAEIVGKLERVFLDHKPRIVLVIGDVTSTLAGAVAAASADIPVAHVEAGLRSQDRSMPEEVNRVMTDSIAQWYFVSEPAGLEHLRREGQSEERMYLVGDLIADALRAHEAEARREARWERWNLKAGAYGLVTLHRPANVDRVENLKQCLEILRQVARSLPLIVHLHPRTAKRLQQLGLHDEFERIPNLLACEPLEYLGFLSLMTGAKLVISDSGGIQLETTLLDVPCLTLRGTTERPMTIERGTNTLVDRNLESVLALLGEVESGRYKKCRLPEYWDGRTAERIAAILAELG